MRIIGSLEQCEVLVVHRSGKTQRCNLTWYNDRFDGGISQYWLNYNEIIAFWIIRPKPSKY